MCRSVDQVLRRAVPVQPPVGVAGAGGHVDRAGEPGGHEPEPVDRVVIEDDLRTGVDVLGPEQVGHCAQLPFRLRRIGIHGDDLSQLRRVGDERLLPFNDRRDGSLGGVARVDAGHQRGAAGFVRHRHLGTDQQDGPVGQPQHLARDAAEHGRRPRPARVRSHHQQGLALCCMLDQAARRVDVVDDAPGVAIPAEPSGPSLQLESVDVGRHPR